MSVKERILDVLSEAEGPMAPQDIAKKGDLNPNSVRSTVRRMDLEGELEKISRAGTYALPKASAENGNCNSQNDTPDGPASLFDHPKSPSGASARPLRGVQTRTESYFNESAQVIVFTQVERAAQDGIVTFAEQGRERFSIPIRFIEKIIGFAPPSEIGIHFVRGDAMEGVFKQGDMVIYEPHGQVPPSGGGLYIILLDGEPVAKRVERFAAGGYKLISENKRKGYSDEILVAEDTGNPAKFRSQTTDALVDLRVAGEVLWPKRDTGRIRIEDVNDMLYAATAGARGQEHAAEAGGQARA